MCMPGANEGSQQRWRSDTSFPFLAIARRYGVTYQTVLDLAEGFENGSLHIGGMIGGAMGEVRHAVMAERERRKLVTTPL